MAKPGAKRERATAKPARRIVGPAAGARSSPGQAGRPAKAPASAPTMPAGRASRLRLPTLAAAWTLVVAVALWTRLSSLPLMLADGEIRFVSGDAYLHLRRILLSVESYPSVAYFDNYNGYPEGMEINWPPLWDFLVASVALIAGLGRPDESTVRLVAAWMPAITGLATLAPIGLATRYVFGSRYILPACLVAAFFVPLVQPTLLGNVDHHAPIVFFLSSLLAVVAWALAGSTRDQGNRTIRLVLLSAAAISGALLTWLGFVLPLGFIWAALLAAAFLGGRRHRAAVWGLGLGFVLAAALVLPFALRTETLTFASLSAFHVLLLAACGMSLLAVQQALDWSGRLGRPVAGAAMVLLAAGVGAALILQPRLMAVLVGGIIKMFGQYPWSQETGEWAALILTENGPSLASVDLLYGRAAYLLPVAALVLALYHRRQAGPGPGGWFFYGWAAVSALLALQAMVFSQLFAASGAIILGVGLAVAWRELAERLLRWGQRPFRSALSAGSVGALLLLLISLPDVGRIAEGVQYAPDFHATLRWLREKTPPPGHFLDVSRRPEYGILTSWDLGDAVVAQARRPATVDGNNETNLRGFVLSQSFFQTQDEEEAVRILEENSLRYVVVGTGFAYFQGNLWHAGPPDGFPPADAPVALGSRQLPPETVTRILFTRLMALGDRSTVAPSRLRAVHVGANHRDPILVYERVSGARVQGQAPPDSVVTARLTIRGLHSNRYSPRFETRADPQGAFQLVLPYSTREGNGDLRAEGSYTVTAGGQSYSVDLTDSQVRNGERVACCP